MGNRYTSGDIKNSDLIILGGGSAAFSAAIKASELGANTVIVNGGLPIGGTCVNVGCVPSKTLIRAADSLHRASHSPFAGIELDGKLSDFKAVIAQKQELVKTLRQARYLDVIKDYPNVQITEGRGLLIDSGTVRINGTNLRAERIIIATGSSPSIPPIEGLVKTGYLTSESLFELGELPESVIVLGGRYIALECAQMLARFGSRVAILQRSARILPTEQPDITDILTKTLEEEGIGINTNVKIESVRRDEKGVAVTALVKGRREVFKASHILCATGRKANTADIGLEKLGVELAPGGSLMVAEDLQTIVSGLYGAGDVIGEPMFVYTAAYEGALAAENALNASQIKRDYTALPWVIFTDPQLAGVGFDERQARESGIDSDVSILPLTYVSRSLVARDTRGLIKLIRETKTDRLVGARVLAAEGAEIIMEAALAIKYGITVTDLASSFHPYLTLSEGIKLAALGFKKDVSKLSCCAG